MTKQEAMRQTGSEATMMLESREVLADAYARKRHYRMLSHAVELDTDGRELRVLCRRVKLDSA